MWNYIKLVFLASSRACCLSQNSWTYWKCSSKLNVAHCHFGNHWNNNDSCLIWYDLLRMVQFTLYDLLWSSYVTHVLHLSFVSSSYWSWDCSSRIQLCQLPISYEPQMSTSTISTLLLNNSDSMTLMVLKLCDDGSNWANCEPHIQRTLVSKGLWRHVEGTAIAPKLYTLVAGVPVLTNRMTHTMEDQIAARDTRINDHKKHKYLTQHIILSTTSTHLYYLHPSQQQDQKPQNCTWNVGCGENGHHYQEHAIPAQCGGPAHKHEACWEWWCEDAPCWSQAAFPAHGPTSWQPPKDGFNNIQLMIQYHHHVITTRVILTDATDHNSCGVHKHSAWNIIDEDHEAGWPHHIHHRGSTALCNQQWAHKNCRVHTHSSQQETKSQEAKGQVGQGEIHVWCDLWKLQELRPHQGWVLVKRQRQGGLRAKGMKFWGTGKESRNSCGSCGSKHGWQCGRELYIHLHVQLHWSHQHPQHSQVLIWSMHQ